MAETKTSNSNKRKFDEISDEMPQEYMLMLKHPNCKIYIKNGIVYKVVDNFSKIHDEIRILKILQEIPNNKRIVKFYGYEKIGNNHALKFEKLNISLFDYIYSPKYNKNMTIFNVLKILFQTLDGMCFLRDNKIMHLDLKPGNIMIDKNGFIKIIDFGLSRLEHEKLVVLVQTRWYRAPEILMRHVDTQKTKISYYTDMWSFGCIIYELLTFEPMFQYETEVELLLKIFSLLGVPPYKMIKNWQFANQYFNIQNKIVTFKKELNISTEQEKIVKSIKVRNEKENYTHILQNIIIDTLIYDGNKRPTCHFLRDMFGDLIGSYTD